MFEQGLLGLVGEAAGIDLVVEAEEGLVRVVCPNAQLGIKAMVQRNSDGTGMVTICGRALLILVLIFCHHRWLALLSIR